MKCSRCEHEAKYAERRGGTCPKCQGKFAFEPRTGDPFTDVQWQNALDWVSSDGAVRFTLSQLHHALAHRRSLSTSSRVALFWPLVVGQVPPLLLFLATESAALGAWASALSLGLVLLFRALTKPSFGLKWSREDFEKEQKKWVNAHGKPPMLIVPKKGPARPAPTKLADELTSYSFDRAVFCDRPETVDFLLANDFHFENNCAVLTADGYPPHAFPTVRKMLTQNPRLEVFVLHDATPLGCTLASRLRESPGWFGGSVVTVTDVGLRPVHAMKAPSSCWDEPDYADAQSGLSKKDRDFLGKHRMELAALRPEQLIKRLFRAMSSAKSDSSTGADPTTGSTGGTDFGPDGDDSFGADAESSDGGADSFG
ncbi:MAG: hypothetical protein EXR76_12215 [Myxococcales bacterium]|nr:hypothetical protein [Myxococcales bacterium]